MSQKINDDDVKSAFLEKLSDKNNLKNILLGNNHDDVNSVLLEKLDRKQPDEDKRSNDEMNIHPAKVHGSSTGCSSTLEQILNPNFDIEYERLEELNTKLSDFEINKHHCNDKKLLQLPILTQT